MLEQAWADLLATTCDFIERHFQGRYAIMKIALVAAGIAWLIAPPLYDFAIVDYGPNSPLFVQQGHPFTPNHLPIEDHWAKTQFRLVPPVIGHLFGFGPIGYFALQILSFLVIIYGMARLLMRATGDTVLTAMGMFALAATGVGAIANVDAHGWFDGIAIAFLILAMLSERLYLLFACLFLAFFTDERAVIASPMVLIYHLSGRGVLTRLELRDLWKMNRKCWTVVGAVIAYLVCRAWLSYQFGLFTPWGATDAKYLAGNINEWLIGIWAPLEGMWIIVAGSLIILGLRRDYWLLAALLLSLGMMTFTSLMVNDISRSMSYVVITLPLAAAIVVRNEASARPIFFAVMLMCLVTPTYMVTGSVNDFKGGYRSVSQLLPLPLAAWHLFR